MLSAPLAGRPRPGALSRPDRLPEKLGEHFIIRVDETGEGYLYPKERFAAVTLPRSAKRALSAAT